MSDTTAERMLPLSRRPYEALIVEGTLTRASLPRRHSGVLRRENFIIVSIAGMCLALSGINHSFVNDR